jgi:hypothetical protein
LEKILKKIYILKSRFVSFYSSGLFTIKKIFADKYNIKFEYISLDYRDINKNFILITKNAETGYKQEGIRLLNFNI